MSVANPDLSSFSLASKTAVVTGANTGIGQAIAVGLARAGARVALVGRSAMDETVAMIGGDPNDTLEIRADLSTLNPVQEIVDKTVAWSGGLDILVNNAGVEEVRPSLDVTEDIWDRIVDTNLKGSFFCAQAAARIMAAAQGGGTIINLCSLTSEVGIPTAAPYGSSKTGLLGMTRALAAEWAPIGIRVNAIAPGYFRTAMTEVFYASESWQAAMLSKIPMGRFGNLADLDGIAVFLASGASAYITGQCFPVDGGFLASV